MAWERGLLGIRSLSGSVPATPDDGFRCDRRQRCLTGVLARLKSPIPFDAVDDRPVDLVCLLLLPAGTSGANLNALACVSRILRDPTLVEAVRRSETAAEIHLAIVSYSNVR